MSVSSSVELLKSYQQFLFPQARELVTQFLALLSGLLVLTVTFAEKLVQGRRPTTAVRVAMALCWAQLLAALCFAGLGLLNISRAAVEAATTLALYAPECAQDCAKGVGNGVSRVASLSGQGQFLVIFAGMLLVASLTCLVVVGVAVHTKSDEDA